MPVVVYGIKNCNTVKSALQWLKENNVDYEFHDYKTRGIEEAKLKKMVLPKLAGKTWSTNAARPGPENPGESQKSIYCHRPDERKNERHQTPSDRIG